MTAPDRTPDEDPLLVALQADDVAALEVMARKSPAFVQAPALGGWTPLHLAAFYAADRCTAWLLAQGASLTAISDNHIANQPLHAALAGAGHVGIVQRLLDAGADVQALGAGAVTPLHLAASRGRDDLVDLLLARGASPQATMTDGQTPAQLAAARGFPDLAHRLAALP